MDPAGKRQLVNILWRSPHEVHQKIFWEQFAIALNPITSKKVNVPVMNENLVQLLTYRIQPTDNSKAPVIRYLEHLTTRYMSCIDLNEAVFSQPPFKANVGMESSALLFIHLEWNNNIEGRQRLVMELGNFCPSIRMDKSFQQKVLEYLSL